TKSLHDTAASLRQVASRDASAGDALRLADALEALEKAAPSARTEAATVLLSGATTLLEQIRDSLQPQPISIATLPPDLVEAWLAPDGRARVSITAKGDANDNVVLNRFLAAGIKVIPDATGTPLSIHEA